MESTLSPIWINRFYFLFVYEPLYYFNDLCFVYEYQMEKTLTKESSERWAKIKSSSSRANSPKSHPRGFTLNGHKSAKKASTLGLPEAKAQRL